jgi:hypothetical protein
MVWWLRTPSSIQWSSCAPWQPLQAGVQRAPVPLAGSHSHPQATDMHCMAAAADALRRSPHPWMVAKMCLSKWEWRS